MFRVLGSPKTLCNGMTRRDLLQVGGASFAGLSLPQILSQQAQAGGVTLPGFGRAKNCIILFLYGSPSQLETFDMKPQAPVEVRGTIGAIPSSLPGLDVCELLPNTAQVMDRCTVVRSVTHPYPIHGVAFAMTGTPFVDVGMELNPRDERHHPYFGSCVEFIDRQRRGGQPAEFVQNVALPFPFSSKRSDQPYRAGPYAAFLEGSYQPVWTEFVGTGTVNVHKDRTGFAYDGPEPYVGCSRDSHFRLASVDSNPEVTVDRLNRRKSLLQQFDEGRMHLERTAEGTSLSKFQQMAYSIVSSPKVRDALDIRNEPDAIRDRYGRTLFGQSCLAARRMVEAGTRCVSVFWDEYGLAGDAWDTHDNHFTRMINQLCPGLDKGFAGLILDLEERGMLDDTLVFLVSEHGRTPKIANVRGGGRDHWSQAYSVVMAGGGTPRGKVIGATDSIAGEVTDRPISPKSLHATMYHLLGIDPFNTHMHDHTGTPVPLVPEVAEIVPELIA
jgi:hypothetical protein